MITKDALPFAKTVGNRARIYGVNTIGLVRRKFSSDSITKLRRAYRYLLHSNTSRALAQIERDPIACSAKRCSTWSTSSAHRAAALDFVVQAGGWRKSPMSDAEIADC